MVCSRSDFPIEIVNYMSEEKKKKKGFCVSADLYLLLCKTMAAGIVGVIIILMFWLHFRLL